MIYAHYTSFILYGFAVISAFYNIWLTTKFLRTPWNVPPYMSSAFVIVASIWFIALQIDWVMNNHNEAVGDLTSLAWLGWDYWNALVYIIINVTLGTGILLVRIIEKRVDTCSVRHTCKKASKLIPCIDVSDKQYDIFDPTEDITKSKTAIEEIKRVCESLEETVGYITKKSH